MEWMCAKTKLIWGAICTLKIEPFVVLFIMSSALSDITTQQLVQDKICLGKYNQTTDYCIGISRLKTSGIGNGDEEDNTKNKILSDLAQFYIYTTIIGSLPSFFYVLFIGSWTDNYIHGRKITLLLGTLGYIGLFGTLLFNAINFQFGIQFVLFSIQKFCEQTIHLFIKNRCH